MTERIGFIGPGLMGHGMAKNIVEKGYRLTVLGHRNRGPIEDLVGRGAQEAKSARELAEDSDVVVLCVTGSAQVEALVSGPDGLMAGAHDGLVIVDCSTSEPSATKRIAAALAENGVAFADAPLGRTPKQAWEGTLATMVGADDAVFASIEPVLACFASTITHVGGVGDGHVMKLINNFLSLGYAALYAEALTLAQKTGIEPARFDSVIRGSRMDCGFYQTFMQYVLDRDPDAHKFTLRNGLKDTTYLETLAHSVDMANPLGSAVKNSFALAVGGGHGERHVPMLSDIIAEMNGTSLAQ